ncbi:tail fiber protein (plasmid) [Serratia marcescens]|uniref:tail fiber protein n=1 Tax=Serratia marcescens TaxID=615 RepID=UPI001880F1C6|nr:tail fiber protein [Serratia marcescens]QOV56309.1 tail fiber protein [Serratia marcescens]
MADIPFGTIVMYSGRTIPNGWLLCDGKNDTPDLIDKFILGGHVEDIGGEGGGVISGGKTNKTKSVSTTQSTTGIRVEIKDTALTIKQMPSHAHSTPVEIDSGVNNTFWGASGSSGNGNKYQGVGFTNQWNVFPINNEGNGEGHSHDCAVSDDKHNHSVDVMLPYYILVFIIYVG